MPRQRLLEARWREGESDRVYLLDLSCCPLDLAVRIINNGLMNHHANVPKSEITWRVRNGH